MYELTEIMHQKDDKAYAELLNRLHEGKQTEHDLAQLRKRFIDPKDQNYPRNAPQKFFLQVIKNQ